MISVSNLSYSAAGRELFRKADFTIEPYAHCALIGANGAGKTTLIDLMLNPDDYLFKGKVIMTEVHNIGYVNQFVEHQKDRAVSVFEYLSEDFETMQREMDALCDRLETAGDVDAVMEQYQNAIDKFTALDGYNYEVNILRRLMTAELEDIKDVCLADISGGEYKLVQIIRQMLRLPDLLVMDEPDVFLDFDNLKGLRELINSYEGTVLVATHSRYLLNHCFDKILQIEDRDIQEFDGTYTEFCLTRLRMKIAMQEISKKESDFIAFEEAVVERLRDDASKHPDLKKGKTLRARVSYVERWKARHVEEPYIESRMPLISLPEVGNTEGKTVLSVESYGVKFDEQLLENVSFEIKAGEKVALVGANGTGKTTLLREIWKGENPSIRIDRDTKVGFLSQFHGETLNEEQTVRQLMDSLGFINEQSAGEYLADYCFEDDILYRPIRTLSGGEKNLLQLVCLSLSGAGLLLLDEPTSHLDLYAQKALEKAVSEYTGAVLMVSHDFYAVTGCMDRVLLFENGTVRAMSGRAFRKMIYKRHFSLDYLDMEQKKKELEAQINASLREGDFEGAKTLCEKLDALTDATEA
ncbi:MAG: ATP-binding cassette domain-containing protein [Eubacteriales bacterium]|nr:ATP-binding cassette domain-containing protein [Eubacteriales bacterium]